MPQLIQSFFQSLSFWQIIPLVVIGFCLIAVLLQWLWNTTLPELFYFRRIAFWQSVRLLLLSLILTGGGSTLMSYTVSHSTTTSQINQQTIERKELKFGIP